MPIKAKNNIDNIRYLLRKNLNEALKDLSDAELASRNIPVIWHVCHTRDVDNIFAVGFDRVFNGGNVGNAYGAGVYSSYYLKDAQNMVGPSYGTAIIMAKIPNGFKKFLVYTDKEARYIFGRALSIEDQLRNFTKNENLVYQFSRYSAGELGRYHQEDAWKLGIEGIIYDWGGGHVCVLPFNFKLAVPYKVSFDRGNTWENRFNADVRKTFENAIDPVFELKGKYGKSQVGLPVYIDAYGYGFVPISKGYKCCNMVELGSGHLKEISPVDFQSMTKLVNSSTVPEDGFFSIEYNGRIYKAWPWSDEYQMGFFEADDGEIYTFDELPQVGYRSIAENKLRSAFKKAINEELSTAGRKVRDKYRFPSPQEIDNIVKDPFIRNKNLRRGGPTLFTCVPSNAIRNIFDVGFSRAFKGETDKKNTGENRSWYGDGVYLNFEFYRSQHTAKTGKYGDAVLECTLVGGFDRFLLFDEPLAKRYYGDDYSIKSQVYKLFPENVARKVWADMEDVMRREYMATEEHHFRGQTSILPQYLLRERYVGHEQREYYERLFAQYNIRGVVYTGGNDGRTAAVYDYGAVLPVAMYDADSDKFVQEGPIKNINGRGNGQSFAFNYDYSFERVENNVDMGHKFGHLYKKFGNMMLNGPDEEGNIVTYCSAQRNNGEWTYINVKEGREICDIGFSYVTPFSESGGYQFQFSVGVPSLQAIGIKNVGYIKNIIFEAMPMGYCDPLEGDDEDAWHTFDDLSITLKNIDRNYENQKYGSVGRKDIDYQNSINNDTEND